MSNLTVFSKRNYDDLPPRVIISKILIFLSTNVCELEGRYCLFGYFKKDRFRNPWFLFGSLKFKCGSRLLYRLNSMIYSKRMESMPDTHICVRKTRFIHLVESYKGLTQLIIDHSEEFINLERLVVECKEDMNEDVLCLNNLFSKNKCFPHLQNLTIIQSEDHTISNYWWESPIWKRLESLIFTRRHGQRRGEPIQFSTTFEKIFHSLDKQKLKKLSLRGFVFQEKVELCFPNLEILELRCCKNIFIDTGMNLKKLAFSDGVGLRIKPVFTNLRKIREIVFVSEYIHVRGETDLTWFLDTSVNSSYSSTITKIRLYSSNFKGDKPENSFGANVEEIHLTSCHNLEERIFEKHEYPNAKTLVLSKLRLLEFNKTWPLSNNLVHLTLCDVPKLKDVFFQNNHFISLETLIISDLLQSILLGKDWSIFPKLEYLGIHNVSNQHIPVLRMANIIFPKLDVLEIRDIRDIDGDDWVLPKCLTVLILDQLDSFRSSFFESKIFESLEELNIQSCQTLTFRNWIMNDNPPNMPSKFPNLQRLCIIDCNNMSIEYFKELEFPRLGELIISAIDDYTGIYDLSLTFEKITLKFSDFPDRHMFLSERCERRKVIRWIEEKFVLPKEYVFQSKTINTSSSSAETQNESTKVVQQIVLQDDQNGRIIQSDKDLDNLIQSRPIGRIGQRCILNVTFNFLDTSKPVALKPVDQKICIEEFKQVVEESVQLFRDSELGKKENNRAFQSLVKSFNNLDNKRSQLEKTVKVLEEQNRFLKETLEVERKEKKEIEERYTLLERTILRVIEKDEKEKEELRKRIKQLQEEKDAK